MMLNKRLPRRALAAPAVGLIAVLGAVSAGQADEPSAVLGRAAVASGAAALRASAALRIDGRLTSAGAAGRFDVTVELRRGYSSQRVRIGPIDQLSGYDGAAWAADNGIVTVDDLPADAAEAATDAYLARDGWADPADPAQHAEAGTRADGGRTFELVRVTPPGGVPATLWFDAATHLLARSSVERDAGPDMTEYADYRPVGGAVLPYHSSTRDAQGRVTVADTEHAALLPAVPPAALARPQADARGAIASGAASATVPFRFDGGTTGLIVIPLTVRGTMLQGVLDTGGANILTPDGARRVALTGGGGLDVGGVGAGTVRATVTDIGTLTIGDTRLRDQQALVLPLPLGFVRALGTTPLEAIVGFELLSNFRVTVDYAGRTLTLTPYGAGTAGAPAGVALPFRSDGHTPFVEAAIDGATGLFMIDTGNSGGLIVSKQFADAHGLFKGARTVPYTMAGGVGGHVVSDALRARELTLAGTTIPRPIVSVANQTAGTFASRTIAGNIGAEILERFTLTFDYRARTVTFAPNARFGEPFEPNRTGLSIDAVADGMVVLSSAPGTPGTEAGLAPGDVIVAIDGAPAAALGSAGVRARFRGIAPVRLTVRKKGSSETVDAVLTPRDVL